jgi:alpha-D-xyloside xylohydrolase
MLGDDLLVAPVFSADGEVSYYLPDGMWTHYLTGERVSGGRWVRERHGFESVPLLVRPGAVIAEGAVDHRPDYDHAADVTLRVYELPHGARVTTQAATASFVTSRNGAAVTVTSSGAGAWNVLLAGVHSVAGVSGGTAEEHEQGVLIRAAGAEVAVTLSEES